jgi:hypothetical protein
VNTTLFPQLQAFLAVARSRSFSGAARELGVSRSAVSQSVRQLEDALRVSLVARTTRSVSLTDAGRRLSSASMRGWRSRNFGKTGSITKWNAERGTVNRTRPTTSPGFAVTSVSAART